MISPADAQKKPATTTAATTPTAATTTAATTPTTASTAAQTTCTSSSPECCWVVESWKKMEKTTSVSAANATACCSVVGSTTQSSGIPGVTCSSTGIITQINWISQSLKGSIPTELGNLVNLREL